MCGMDQFVHVPYLAGNNTTYPSQYSYKYGFGFRLPYVLVLATSG